MDKAELLEYLRQVDEISLLEVLEITSSDLVDAFSDRILENLDKVYSNFGKQEDL